MPLTIEPERRADLVSKLQGFFREEYDEGLSSFRAEGLVDFFLEAVGPPVYNQAVQDARRYMLGKLEDLDGEVHEPECP